LMIAISLALVMVPAGQDAMYFGFATIGAFFLIFVFSIFETKSEIFECKDTELLLSMPISPSHIVISRVATVLIYNLAEAMVVALPFSIVYTAFGGNSLYAVLGAISVLLASLLATALASAVGYVFALIAKRLKNNTLLTSAISVVGFIVFFVIYYSTLSVVPEDGEEMVQIPDIPIVSALGSASTGNVIALLILAVMSLGAFFIAYRLISASYISIATSSSGAARIKYKREVLKKESALSALTKKELRRFFTSSAYILNSTMGIIFGVLLSVYICFGGADMFLELGGEDIALPSGFVETILIIAVSFIVSMTNISSAALSLEGKNLWILKSMPVSAKTVLLSKTLPHIIITTPPSILVSLLVAIGARISGIYLLPLFLLPLSLNVLFAAFGTVMNVAFPKFEFENEAQPIKQSMAVTLCLLFQMLWSLIISGLIIVSVFLGGELGAIISTLLAVLLTVLITVMLFVIILGPSARRYEKF